MNRLISLYRVAPLFFLALLVSIPYLWPAVSFWHDFPLHEGMPIGQTDPDSWLRLTLVRDWLMGGDWYSHAVTRSNAPFGGIISPWTRPLDMVIAGLASIQPESVDVTQRVLRASLLLPWIWTLLLLWGIYRVMAHAGATRPSYWMAALLLICSPLMSNYINLGNADHHGLLAVIFVWVMAGVLQKAPSWRTSAISGVLLGVGLWVSVEMLMLIVAVYAWYCRAPHPACNRRHVRQHCRADD
jgi:hypothetical protein